MKGRRPLAGWGENVTRMRQCCYNHPAGPSCENDRQNGNNASVTRLKNDHKPSQTHPRGDAGAENLTSARWQFACKFSKMPNVDAPSC